MFLLAKYTFVFVLIPYVAVGGNGITQPRSTESTTSKGTMTPTVKITTPPRPTTRTERDTSTTEATTRTEQETTTAGEETTTNEAVTTGREASPSYEPTQYDGSYPGGPGENEDGGYSDSGDGQDAYDSNYDPSDSSGSRPRFSLNTYCGDARCLSDAYCVGILKMCVYDENSPYYERCTKWIICDYNANKGYDDNSNDEITSDGYESSSVPDDNGYSTSIPRYARFPRIQVERGNCEGIYCPEDACCFGRVRLCPETAQSTSDCVFRAICKRQPVMDRHIPGPFPLPRPYPEHAPFPAAGYVGGCEINSCPPHQVCLMVNVCNHLRSPCSQRPKCFTAQGGSNYPILRNYASGPKLC